MAKFILCFQSSYETRIGQAFPALDEFVISLMRADLAI